MIPVALVLVVVVLLVIRRRRRTFVRSSTTDSLTELLGAAPLYKGKRWNTERPWL